MLWHGVETEEEAWDVLLEFGDYVLEERFAMVQLPYHIYTLIIYISVRLSI